MGRIQTVQILKRELAKVGSEGVGIFTVGQGTVRGDEEVRRGGCGAVTFSSRLSSEK